MFLLGTGLHLSAAPEIKTCLEATPHVKVIDETQISPINQKQVEAYLEGLLAEKGLEGVMKEMNIIYELLLTNIQELPREQARLSLANIKQIYPEVTSDDIVKALKNFDKENFFDGVSRQTAYDFLHNIGYYLHCLEFISENKFVTSDDDFDDDDFEDEEYAQHWVENGKKCLLESIDNADAIFVQIRPQI